MQQGRVRRRRAHRRAHRARRCVARRVHAARRPAVPRAGGPARLLRDRARHLRGAAHHAGHALGQRALRALRHDPRRRGHAPHRCPCIVLVRRRRRRPRLVRARARDPAAARRRRSRSGASTACSTPGPEAEWSELSTNLTLLFLGSLAAQALSYSAALGVLVLAQGPGRTRRGRRLHRRASSSPASRSCCSRRSRPRCSRSSRRSSGAGKHDDFRAGLKKLRHDRGRRRRARRRRRRHASARPSARSSSATSSTSATATSRCCSSAARRSSSPSPSPRR